MKKSIFLTAAFAVAFTLSPTKLNAAALGFAGTAGFGIVGNIGNVSGCLIALCAFDSGNVAFNTGVLADGMQISGFVRQVITESLGTTTSALLLVTGITATNTNIAGPNISDNLFVVSDQFDLSIAGTAGVGIIGAYLSNAGRGGNISFASTQAQMNYLTTGLITQANFGGPLTGFSLTTPSTFVSCFVCSPIAFHEAAFINNAPAGVEQLIGAINFTLGPGSSAILPGSVLIENNNDAAISAELPEPGSMLLLGTGCILLGGRLRRRTV